MGLVVCGAALIVAPILQGTSARQSFSFDKLLWRVCQLSLLQVPLACLSVGGHAACSTQRPDWGPAEQQDSRPERGSAAGEQSGPPQLLTGASVPLQQPHTGALDEQTVLRTLGGLGAPLTLLRLSKQAAELESAAAGVQQQEDMSPSPPPSPETLRKRHLAMFMLGMPIAHRRKAAQANSDDKSSESGEHILGYV